MTNGNSGNPDTRNPAANPAALRAALEAADPATLMLVLVQLTGNRQWLADAQPFIAGPLNYHETMPEQMRVAIREALFDTLTDYAREGRPWPPIPAGALLAEMLSTAAGETVDADYAAMMRADLDPTANAPRELARVDGAPLRVPEGFRVLIIGAGMSGLGAAIHLKEAGIPFVIVERDTAVGGTWHQNSYPGCGVDTPNHFYSYSFEPSYDWSHFFAKRDELWRYFEDVADRHDLRGRIRFGTEVISAHWDQSSAQWRVLLRGPESEEEVAASIIISGVGILSRPKWPDIEGLADFPGQKVHTGAWDPAFEWRDKRIALIGTGASGHQVGPTIAPHVAHLSIFQRSPGWVVPNPNYFLDVSEGKKWALEHIPFYARWYRFQLFWAFADGLHSALKIDPDWPEPARAINSVNERHRLFMERFIKAELGDDSPLLAKVTPRYPPYGKRILIDNRWFQTLKRDNVELVTDAIRRVTRDGVETSDGFVHAVDAIICATGFQASKMLSPMRIVGVDGIELHEFWKPDDATAYQGTMVPGFPNFFMLLGPNTALAHGGNAILIVECQMRLVMNCLRALLTGNHRSVEVTHAAHDAHVAEVDRLHAGMVWTHPGTRSWYRNPAGRVFAVLPFRLVDFWKMTSELDRTAIRLGD